MKVQYTCIVDVERWSEIIGTISFKLKEVHVVHVSSLQTNKFPWLANNLVDNSNHYLQDYVQVMEIFGWQQIQPTGFIDADLKINFSDHFFLDVGWSACMNQT